MHGRIPFRENWGERVVAAVLLALCLPILIHLALVVRFFGGEPILVKDQYARGGEVRECLRFRTSGSGAERFRAVGQYLRRWKLDELPGLWSVVCGEARLREMSFLER